jgi:UDP-glucose 4-epimerase
MYLYMFKELYKLDYSVIRYPNVYGPRQDPNGEAGVVAIFIGQMLAGRPVTINGSGEQVRDFVYVGDCAKANLAMLENGSGGVYNLGYGIGTSVNQIFDGLKAIIGYPQDAHHGPAKAGETFRIYLDASRARTELDWEPSVDLQEGLRRTVEYFKQAEVRK